MKGNHPLQSFKNPLMFTLQTTESFVFHLKLFANLTETPLLIPPSDIFAIMSVDPFQVKRPSEMRVDSNEHPSDLGRFFYFDNNCFSNRKMTSLFRPWTEESRIRSSPKEITTLFSNSSKQPGDSDAREDKYKSVKEHMKKRSEKYLLKKLKRTSAEMEKSEMTKLNDNMELNAMAGFPLCCAPSETCFLSFERVFPRASIPGVNFSGTEFLDATLGQGLSSSVFEEYAKFLTEQQRIVSERSRKQRPKKFRCPHCHVGFSNNGQLKGHIRIHTGERPYKCDAESCGKSFTRNEELTRHRRIHSGLRPFPCSECGKRFGRKDHLKKHIKTHFQQRYQLVPIIPSHCPYFYGL